ncbi:MAG: hypothetical protein KH050_10325 [Clostridiaceae bacterium]|jgi:hypothetical protein|uniref:hypothetical protein n=1 Tax=Massiliimalia timonensis TaxID=1987501 RepID=UPI000B8AE726|nr:hypothetical protein [Massiliimalia timonensis]MBS7225712.1 hypothetical protein [Clostridiaceae bacterium]DAO29439.1 MAG TPA: hypothetical protein [Caudoviricetes sp.]
MTGEERIKIRKGQIMLCRVLIQKALAMKDQRIAWREQEAMRYEAMIEGWEREIEELEKQNGQS